MGLLCCTITRIFLMTVSTIVLVIALGLTVIATIFPTWHTVHVTSKPERILHHGLWMHCIYSNPSEIGPNRMAAIERNAKDPLVEETMEKICDINKGMESTGVTMQAKWLPWKRTVLILMCTTFTMGMVTLFTGFCGFGHKWFTVAWSAGSFISLATSLSAIIVYFINGHEIEGYRTYSMSTYNTFLQELGWCYWVACSAVLAYLVNAVLTVPIAILSFRQSAMKHQPPVMVPWNHNHTAV